MHCSVRTRAGAFTVGALLVLTWLSAFPAHSDAQSIDPTFSTWGHNGAATIGGAFVAHAVQPDGKVVLVGTSGNNMFVARRLWNGNPDPSFGVGGYASITGPGLRPAVPRSVAIQKDGRIAVAGHLDGVRSEFMIARINSDGTMDYTFGGGGWRIVAIGTDSDIAEKVLVQPDGKIVAAGRAYVGGDWDFGVVRVNADGTSDPTFNGTGMQVIGFGGDDYCWDAALQTDGKLVLVGEHDGTINNDFAVCRLNADGQLDATFDGDGKTSTGFGNLTDAARAVAIQPDGKIVAAGFGGIARYMPDGSLDPAFDQDGKVDLPQLYVKYVKDLVVRPDGKILMAGDGDVGGADFYDFRIICLNSDGSPNPGLGHFLGTSDDIPDPPSMTVLPEGRLVAMQPLGSGCYLYRFTQDLFNDADGYQMVGFDEPSFPVGSNESANGMAIQPDGKILLAGEVGYNTSNEAALVRLLPDGTMDDFFGSWGRAHLSLGIPNSGRGVAVQTDGKIVMAGYTATNTNFTVARFTSSGTLDPSFGIGGINIVDFAGGADYGFAVAVAPDGKIVVVGPVWNGSQYVFGIARFTTSGGLDNTFDTDGKRTVQLSPGVTNWATAVVVQSDGRIVVGGFVGTDFGLVRLNLDGSLDGTFGGGGLVVTDMGGNDYLYGLAFGGGGSIYAAGTREVSGHSVFAMAQFNANGTLPGTCSRGQPCNHWPSGKAYVDWGTGVSGSAFAIATRGDGQVAVVGCVGNDLALCQLSVTSTTPTFKTLFQVPPGDFCASAVSFVEPDRIMVGGSEIYAGDHNMTAMRFVTTQDATAGVEDGPGESSAGAQLGPPYPNPTSHQSSFAIDLPQAGRVRLAVYDVAGRLVRTLVDGVLPSGRHVHVWDGLDEQGMPVKGGVYLARLSAGASRAQRSIIVLR